jgi:hypothetical protein
VARDDNAVELWDLERRSILFRLNGHSEQVTSLAFDSRRRLLATASWDETVRLWDIASGKVHRILAGHQGEVTQVIFDPLGVRLVTVCADGLARIWDPRAGTLLTTVGVTGSKLVAAAFSADGRELMTLSEGLQILTWDARTGTMRSSVEGQGMSFSQARFAAGGALLVTSDRVRGALWDARAGKLLLPLEEGGAASVSADGSRVVTVDPALRVASVRRVPVHRMSEEAMSSLLAKVPWRLVERRLVKKPEDPDWLRFPERPLPAAGAPILRDEALGLLIEHRPGWTVSSLEGRHVLEKRVGRRARMVVELALGKPVGPKERERLVETVRERELNLKFGVASHWGTFAGLPAMTLTGPQYTQEAATRWVAVLPEDRPVIFTFALEGSSFDEDLGQGLVAELEGAVRFMAPWADTPLGRSHGLLFSLGEPRILLGSGWRLKERGPGASLTFEGPEGVKAVLRSLGPEGEGAVWCELGERFPIPEEVEVAGVKAMRYLCPGDRADQVFYIFGRRGYWIYLGLTDPKARALAGPAADFLSFMRFEPVR